MATFVKLAVPMRVGHFGLKPAEGVTSEVTNGAQYLSLRGGTLLHFNLKDRLWQPVEDGIALRGKQYRLVLGTMLPAKYPVMASPSFELSAVASVSTPVLYPLKGKNDVVLHLTAISDFSLEDVDSLLNLTLVE